MTQFIKFPIAGAGNITQAELETTEAMQLYVATTGSDSLGTGTFTNPYLTIQKAIDTLPPFIRHAVTITVGAGTFTGCMIEGFVFETLGTDTTGLHLTGTMGTSTLASGLTSGTIDAAGNTAGTVNTTTWGTCTVTGAGWTVNDLAGRFIRIDTGTGAGQIRAISSNTATVITVAGNWTAPTSATFTIVEPATFLNATSNSQIGGAQVYVQGCIGGIESAFVPDRRAIHFEKLNFATGNRGIQIRGDIFALCSNVKFASSTAGVVQAGPCYLEIDDCVFSGIGIFAQEAVVTLVQRCVFIGGAVGVQATTSIAQAPCTPNISLLMNMFRAWTTAAYLGTGMVNLQGCFIDAVTPGSRVGMNFQSPATGRIRNSDISNCGTAVSVFSEYSISGVIFENTVTGTGNTTGISLTKGSKIQIPAATTLTTATSPTGELSIDGVSTTYTVMRAQTPKLVVSDYGSKVYE